MPSQEPINVSPYFISTFPPRGCGIATFTRDLLQATVAARAQIHAGVIAITKASEGLEYPSEVIFEIDQQEVQDYRLATEYINFSHASVVSLQHEFGIFGGPYGSYIIELLESIRKPVVTTLHTVLSEPESGYRESLIRVAAASDRLVVMNSRAIPILREVYSVPEAKIRLIHHGVPEVAFVDPNYYKDKFGVEGRTVFLTFGLLSRNKGIEMMIDALPEVVRRHPDVVYIILGATHPEVKRRDGEEYRQQLQQRVREAGLEKHVIFHDRYVEFNELVEFIGACDIYVTPYASKEQIVSGTLAYAVGMGKAVVSTPYLYAKELLSNNRGRLVNFGDTAKLAQTLTALIENKAARHRMRKRAYKYGQQMTWREVGKQYVDVFQEAAIAYSRRGPRYASRKPTRAGYELPTIKLDHLIRLTDDTGIIQHAAYGVPDRHFGYTTDDAARALVVVLLYGRQFRDPRAEELAARYLSFLQYAQQPDGHFHNFMNYTRQFIDERGSEDTLGRALWGLGATVAYSGKDGLRVLAMNMFERALGALTFKYPRAIAYAICGLECFLQRYEGASRVRRKLRALADQLTAEFQRDPADTWHWFGNDLTYANAKMPQAMLLAYRALEDERFKVIGLESLEFLISQTYRDGRLDFIGNQGWFLRGGERALFGQQPIEAGYMAEACMTAYGITDDRRYRDLALAATEWLLGRNRLGMSLYDADTGAFADGLDPQGPSMNQGAESVICGLLALTAVTSTYRNSRTTLVVPNVLAGQQNQIQTIRPLPLNAKRGYEDLASGE